MQWLPRAAALFATGLIGVAALAQTLPPPQNVASLSASASIDVNKDWLTVVFSTTREGSEAGAVQTQLKLALDAALAEARKVAKPGQVDVQTGAFSLYPRYAPATPKSAAAGMPSGIVGWQGSTELSVEGRDAAAIAQLTGRISTLAIARVGYSLSRQARLQVEGEVTAQAIDRFRQRAEAVARQFGFGGYAVREVNVSAESTGGPQMMAMKAVGMRAGPAEEALPTEAGKATVTVNVNGSVQMK